MAESYIDGWNNIDPSTSPDSEKKAADKLSETDETAETKKKEAKKTTTQEEMNKATAEATEKITERFKWKGDITQGVNPYEPKETLVTDFDVTKNVYNKGGRVGIKQEIL